MVVVAQLVRALDCGSRGRRFEPGLPPRKPAIGRFFLLRTSLSKTIKLAVRPRGLLLLVICVLG